MKKIKILFLICIFFVLFGYGFAKLRTEKDEKLDKLRMTPKTFEKMKNLHKNTYYTAVKAIIGKMGSILYKELPKTEKKLLARCLDKIEDRRELINSAKCVVIARKRFLKIKSEMTKNYLKFTTPSPISKNGNGWKAFLQQFDDFDRLHSFSSNNLQTPSNLTFIPKKQQRNGFFKEKEETRRFSPRKFKKINYDYSFMQNTQNVQSNPFRMQSYKPLLIKKLTNRRKLKRMQASMLERKQYGRDLNPLQSNIKPMQQRRRGYNRLQLLGKKIRVLSAMNSTNAATPRRLREKPVSRRFMKFMHRAKRSVFSDSKDHYYKENRFKIVTKNQFNNLSPQQKSDNPIISSITNVIREFTSENSENKEEEKGNEHLKWTKTYNRLMKVRKAIDEQKRVPGAKVYEHRMFDLVLEREEASLSPKERLSAEGIMHESMKLLGRITSTNNESGPFFRALSPRFMPLMPLNEGKRQPETYLSPTIMAMYDEPNKTNEVSIGNVPGIMRTLGLAQKDRNKIMQLVMDLSGSNVHVDEAIKIYETLGMFDEDIGDPLINATERIMGAFKKLEKNLFPDQKFLYDNRGFAFIKKNQMQNLLKDQGISDNEIDLADFDIYDKMSDEEMEISLWKTIENIANNKTNVLRPSEMRLKRDAIFVLKPTILSPLLFTIQYGAVVLGPLILSPLAFAPPILNPSILSPWILTPGIFDPLILSPYIFSPFILGPLAFTPFILTPYFLSPNVLNPYLITSLILSPIGLSPDIMSPMAIGANILSPSVLSPPVLNPTALTASVLSPSFLS